MKLLLSFALLLFISVCGNEMEHILSEEENVTDGEDLTKIGLTQLNAQSLVVRR